MSSAASNGSKTFTNRKSYKPHLIKNRPDGLGGEVAKLRADVEDALNTAAAITVDEFTNPIAATANSIKTSVASAITAQTYTGAALTGSTHGTLVPPRPVTVTCSDHGATWQGHITVTGTDINGEPMTEDITLNNNATTSGSKCFATVTSVHVPAQADALGTFTIGNAVEMGLLKPIKSRAGAPCAVSEITGSAVIVPTGTITAQATHPPNGAYSPSSAPNGTRDYALYYEYDPLV